MESVKKQCRVCGEWKRPESFGTSVIGQAGDNCNSCNRTVQFFHDIGAAAAAGDWRAAMRRKWDFVERQRNPDRPALPEEFVEFLVGSGEIEVVRIRRPDDVR